ncbi:MAG: protein kinase [Deltaproteobacteria bacterium]|nr:protein kinase [Deltaproteobacteria bacterium]
MAADIAFDIRYALGQGGYGEVYLATEHLPDGGQREVALKVLRVRDPHSDEVKRLRDEAALLALLNHPAILTGHRLSWIDGRLSFVAEFLGGTDLSAYVSPPLLPPRVALEMVAGIAEALDHAWSLPHPQTGQPLRLVHRDIKPDNIRVLPDGSLRLLDFGIAKAPDLDRHARTAAGAVLLTPGYGPPELLAFGVSTAAGDVYALGVTLFQLLTGEELHQGRPIDYQLALAFDTESYREFLEERLELPPLGTELLADCLQYPSERRPTARRMAEACRTLAGRLTDEPSLTAWARAQRFPEPRPVDIPNGLQGHQVSRTGKVIATERPAPPRAHTEARQPPAERSTPQPPAARSTPMGSATRTAQAPPSAGPKVLLASLVLGGAALFGGVLLLLLALLLR